MTVRSDSFAGPRRAGRIVRQALAASVCTLLLAAAAGCGGPATVKHLSNPDPLGKVPAIKRAARTNDQRSVRQLVKDLEDEDPAIRFYASRALKRLTGETFGYDYYDDEEQRQPAVKAWQAWLAERR